jgi:hypothetical protein
MIRITDTLHETLYTFMVISGLLLLRMNILDGTGNFFPKVVPFVI